MFSGQKLWPLNLTGFLKPGQNVPTGKQTAKHRKNYENLRKLPETFLDAHQPVIGVRFLFSNFGRGERLIFSALWRTQKQNRDDRNWCCRCLPNLPLDCLYSCPRLGLSGTANVERRGFPKFRVLSRRDGEVECAEVMLFAYGCFRCVITLLLTCSVHSQPRPVQSPNMI